MLNNPLDKSGLIVTVEELFERHPGLKYNFYLNEKDIAKLFKGNVIDGYINGGKIHVSIPSVIELTEYVKESVQRLDLSFQNKSQLGQTDRMIMASDVIDSSLHLSSRLHWDTTLVNVLVKIRAVHGFYHQKFKTYILKEDSMVDFLEFMEQRFEKMKPKYSEGRSPNVEL